MSQTITVIAPIATVINGTDYRAADLSNYKSGVLSCKLVAAEEVTIFKCSGPDVVVASNSSGTAQKLTATITSLVLEGGVRYLLLKTICADPYGVYLDLGPALNE